MKFKQIPPCLFFVHRQETTLQELASLMPISQQLVKEAAALDLGIGGAIQWHYYGFQGPPNPFMIELALPVLRQPENYSGQFHFKESEVFDCIAERHEGRWEELPVTYGRMMKFLEEKKLTFSGSAREVYVLYNQRNPAGNVTDVQLGYLT